MIQQTVSWVLARCGDAVTLCHADGTEEDTVAVIQPLRQKNDRQRAPTPLGGVDEVRYLYLGMPACPLCAGEGQVLWQGRVFTVQSAHPIYVGNACSHWWATLVACDEEVAE